MSEVLLSPWDDVFVQLIRSAHTSADICAPFVNRGGTDLLLKDLTAQAHVRLLSSFNAAHFCGGYSDTRAFRDVLLRGGEVKNCQRLHAKIYLFDQTSAVVTSANLTNGGLRTNVECGVLLRDNETVAHLSEAFAQLWDDEASGRIGSDTLDEIESIVRLLPRQAVRSRHMTPDAAVDIEEPELVLEGVETEILSSLSGWKHAVFEVLTGLDGIEFDLSDVYEFAPSLGQQYPENTEVKAKIRQQLQMLRDRGLIRFLGEGRYRKLWV
ncbi:MAG: hypothetical protein GX131_03100 [candidate division WS1 bacterium]|jgi:hypothetical protein|nr:hypothetical protein [candidate division WS1 bacterium]